MIKLIKAYTLSECLDAMSEQAQAYEGLGQENIIFCEDRLTLVAERALLRRLGGTFLTEITTFSRFVRSDKTRLSRQGSVMAVGDIMLRLLAEGKLCCFKTAQSIAANATCIYEQLAQFSASELTSESLQKSVEELTDEALKNKMRDLALIFAEYEAFLLQNNYVDEGKYLTLLPQYLREVSGISRKNVFFLCYSSFTTQALKTVCAAMESARNVIGIFCADESELYTNQAYARFASVVADYESKGVKVLRENKGVSLDGEAEILRKGFYSLSAVNDAARNGKVPTEKFHIFAAADKMSEAEYVAVQIRKLLAENPQLHYRDFAVLAASVDEYSLAMKKAFCEFQIPFSMDERIPLKRHPMAKFILACLTAVKERMSPVAVDGVLKNVFFGPSDGYRNYLLKFGNYRGGAAKEIKFTGENATEEEQKILKQYGRKEDLLACRERLLSILSIFPMEATGKFYCDAVMRLLSLVKAGKTLTYLMEQTQDEGTRSYLEQIDGKLKGLLEEAERLTCHRKMQIGEFLTILSDGLEATEIAPNPLRLDAVFVGGVAESRIECVRYLFALGMTDAVPNCSGDANLITDKDKDKLQLVSAAIEPLVEEVNLRNRESVCLNLCTFTDGLYLTYPLGASGEAPTLSDVFRYVKGLFCCPGNLPILDAKQYDEKDFAYRCSSLRAAARQLMVEKGEYELRRTDSRREFSSLYQALEGCGGAPLDVYAENGGVKTVEQAEALFFTDGVLSPSSLEGYFTCPYQNFATRGLRLKERDEAAVLAVDTGNFVHALLQCVSGKINDFADEESFAKYAKDVGMSLLNASSVAFASDTLSGIYSNEQLLEEGVTVACAVFRQIRMSDFQIVGMEREVRTDNFRGKIDRVDESTDYVRVIDYKTGNIDDSASAYYTGRKIQMQLYMSAVRGDKIPAGVFYFPAATSFSADGEGEFRMQGFLNGDVAALQCGDRTLTAEKKSEFFEAKLTKNHSEKVMAGDVFMDFLDYVIPLTRGAAQEMREGFIAPSPYKDGCRYCRYGGMCGFNRDVHAERKENNVTPKMIAKIAKKEREGGEDE